MISIGLLFLLILSIIIIFYTKLRNLNKEIENLMSKISNLEKISDFFPEFIKKGEVLTKNISDELSLKKNMLNNLIIEAERVSDKLDHLERKLKNNEINKETIDNVLILINQGFSPEEISPRLNIPLGEIELIVKLKKYLNSPIKERL